MRVFFHDSYVIAGIDDPEPVPDPYSESVPAKKEIYVYQKDSSFGENVSRVEYRNIGDGLSLSMFNMDTMHYFIFPLVSPGDLHLHMSLMPLRDENALLFYGVAGVDSVSFFGIEKSKEDSFYNRIKAVYSWFTGRLEE